MDTIVLDNIPFPIRTLWLKRDNVEVLLSTISLNKRVITADGNYTSTQAEEIDNLIFYYLDEEEMQLTDSQLNTLLEKIL